METTTTSALEHLSELIRGIDVVMLTTSDRAGRLHSRPMMALRKNAEGALWFFAQGSSHTVDDIHGHHPVNLSYVDAVRGIYVSVSGRARVISDREKKSELWERRLGQWLSNGPEDDSTVLLRVEVQEAEYWQWHGGRELSASIEVSSASGGLQHEQLLFQ